MQAFLIAFLLMALFLLLRVYGRRWQWNPLLPYFAILGLAVGFLGTGVIPVKGLAAAFSMPADVAEFLRQTTMTLVAGVAGILLFAAIRPILKLQQSKDDSPYERFVKVGAAKFLLFLGLYVPAFAMLEELIFRAVFIGLGIGSGDNVMTEVALIICSSVTFGLAHFRHESPGQAVHATIAGLIWGCAFTMTGSIWVPVAAHATHNIVMLSLLYIRYHGAGKRE